MQLGFGSVATKYVWLGGVSSSVTEKSLVAKLSLYGTITHHFLLRDIDQAVLEFESKEAAAKVVVDMRGRNLGGSKLQVLYTHKQHIQGYQVHTS